MDSMNRFIKLITKFFDGISQVGVIAMLVVLVGNILLRKFGKPIFGAIDFVSFINAIVVAFAIPYCAVKKGHTQVDLVMTLFSKRTQGVFGVITGILGLCIFLLIAWQCIVLGNDMRRAGEVTMTALLPFHPYIFAIAFGCALLCLVILGDLIQSAVKAVKR